jgi:hypothetical protein
MMLLHRLGHGSRIWWGAGCDSCSFDLPDGLSGTFSYEGVDRLSD